MVLPALTENPNSKTTQNDPGYFASYLNMAMHNLFITIEDINNRSGFNTSVSEEANILDFPFLKFLNSTPNDALRMQRIIHHLEKAFPILSILVKKQSDKSNYQANLRNQNQDKKVHETVTGKEFYRQLEFMINELNAYRNQYAHRVRTEHEFKPELVNKLNHIFEWNRRVIMERKGYKSDEVKHLVPFDKNNNKYTDGLREYAKYFKYGFRDTNKSELSQNGLIFLTCLFLEPKYITLFIKKIKGFKHSTGRKFQATIDIFSTNTIKIPLPRLESQYTESSLPMIILNHLMACPIPLHKVLPPDKQQIFKNIEGEIWEDDQNKDLYFTAIQDLRKSEKRFTDLILRYFDYNNLFNKIRFQLFLGKYIFCAYEQMIDNKIEIRRLSKTIKGFAKINQIEESEIWNPIKKLTHEIPHDSTEVYITDSEPRYYRSKGNVFLKLVDPPQGNADPISPWPEMKDKMIKDIRVRVPKYNTMQNDIIVLSERELLPLGLLYFLKKDENIISGTIEQFTSNYLYFVTLDVDNIFIISI